MGLLEEEFRRRDVPCIMTREPGGTPFGREVREILLSRDGSHREPVSELLLYLADRYQHLQEVVEPALRRGVHVVADRYHDATLAYQGYARGIGLEYIQSLAKILLFRKPDLTLVLDLEVEQGLERARLRNARERLERLGRFESEEVEFHRRVRQGYRILAAHEPERIRFVDATGTPEEVFSRIRGLVEKLGAFDAPASSATKLRW